MPITLVYYVYELYCAMPRYIVALELMINLYIYD